MAQPLTSHATPTEDTGKLLLRLTVGILVLLHGVAKLTGGVGAIVGMVGKLGLPPALGYLVLVGEVLGPLLLIIGAWTRLGALLVAINMIVAVVVAHAGDIVSLNQTGGWALELQGMFLFGSLAIALLGAGRYSAGGADGRWN